MPLTRRQVYRRRRIVALGSSVVALAVALYLPMALLAPIKPSTTQIEPWNAPVVSAPVIDFPPYGASALGAVGYAGTLASAGDAAPLPIASISKVITALVVLDYKPLIGDDAGPPITFGPQDEQFYENQRLDGGSVESVYSGQVLTQRTVMTVMLLASANNYAQSLASWAFGSEALYVERARAWLISEGLSKTTIIDASGVSPSNRSTIADLVEIAKIAEQQPVVAAIVALPSAEVADLGTVVNRNALVQTGGINGIKTGTLDEAGSCLLFSQNLLVGTVPVTVVGVVLGGPDHESVDAAVRSLLRQADTGFVSVRLATAGQAFARYSSVWGDTAAAVAERTVEAVIWSGTPIVKTLRLREVLTAPVGAEVGNAIFTAGVQDFPVTLRLDAAIDDPGPWWRMTNPTEIF